jgi:hypothetical protein
MNLETCQVKWSLRDYHHSTDGVKIKSTQHIFWGWSIAIYVFKESGPSECIRSHSRMYYGKHEIYYDETTNTALRYFNPSHFGRGMFVNSMYNRSLAQYFNAIRDNGIQSLINEYTADMLWNVV